MNTDKEAPMSDRVPSITAQLLIDSPWLREVFNSGVDKACRYSKFDIDQLEKMAKQPSKDPGHEAFIAGVIYGLEHRPWPNSANF